MTSRFPESWKLVPLEDAIEKLIDYRGKTPKKVEQGIPLVTAKIVKKGEVLPPNEFIAPEDYDSWMTRGLPEVGDVVLTVEAPLGEVAQLKNAHIALAQRIVTLRGKKDYLDNTYLKYALMSPFGQSELTARESGSTVKGIKQSELKKVLIPVPPFQEQLDMAKILNNIDEKIRNNTAMNATLEKIAQRIFKSWFVDFDPVKANAEGVPFDGLSPEIQSLFPNEFEESELGMIPKGWEVSNIEKEVKTVGGATPSTKNPDFWNEGDVLWTTPKDLSDLKDKVIFNTARKITSLGLKKISSGLLPKDTVLMSSRAPVGYLAIAKEPMAINQGYIAMKCEQDITPYYMLCWLDKNMEIIKQRAGGTTFSEISKTNFRPIEFLKPSVNTINKFEQIVTPIFERIETNARMTNNLSKIRDKLLPRLISGKITIQKAEELLEEAS